jgi:predicted nucleic acid-binding protein
MKLYFDTNIFLDYLLERKNLEGKDISKPSQKLFYRALQCEFFIVYSDHTATEINKIVDGNKIRMLFAFLNKKVVMVTKTEEDIAEAQKMSETNFSDALHAALAKKSGADYLITRNVKDFELFSSYIKPRTPEDI